MVEEQRQCHCSYRKVNKEEQKEVGRSWVMHSVANPTAKVISL